LAACCRFGHCCCSADRFAFMGLCDQQAHRAAVWRSIAQGYEHDECSESPKGDRVCTKKRVWFDALDNRTVVSVPGFGDAPLARRCRAWHGTAPCIASHEPSRCQRAQDRALPSSKRLGPFRPGTGCCIRSWHVAAAGWSDAAESVGQGSLGEAVALDGLVVTGGCALNIKVNQVWR
jgi:hypothetical protein